MERLKCVILDDYQGVATSIGDWGALSDRVEVTTIREHLTGDELASRLEGCVILIVMRERTPIPAPLLERLPDLRLLITSGMRNASIDVKAASERGVTVCGTRSFSEPPAELTWALIFALTRNLHIELGNIKDGGWQTTLGSDLHGRTIGVVGLGKIGKQIVNVANAFGMRVNVWSPNLTEQRAQECAARLVTKEELFSKSDIVTLHLVLSSRSAGIVGRSELELMQPHALLINTSRAGLVDGAALENALVSRRIGGAGLDVFEQEPLPQTSIYRSLKNVVATPHLGYVTRRNYTAYFEEAVEDITAFLKGTPVRVLS
ncbi:D-2-hydroxyacid dehydrogenase family protein [Xanthobacter sp.]|uniref:D-2-hydroxyacid dehydrogenase family protein n=1 Tax=Xanthobacter sp. TaxID=35809 RepID=UPI0025F13B03|nr:D-2-hydroxyacid dehydrogenase family protein [Xanthobacter sp.]